MSWGPEDTEEKRLLPPADLHSSEFASFGRLLSSPRGEPRVNNLDLAYHARMFQFPKGQTISLGIMTCKVRSSKLRQLERHASTPELLANLGDRSVIVVAPSTDDGHPDESKLKSFEIHPGDVIVLNTGVWHWAPFPAERDTSFLVGFSLGTEDHDLETVTLKQTYVLGDVRRAS